MGDKHKKKEKDEIRNARDKAAVKARRRRDRKFTPDQQSDRKSATDLVARIEQLQEDLGDLIYEFRYLKRFSELTDVSFLTWRLDLIRKKCVRFADGGSWEKDE